MLMMLSCQSVQYNKFYTDCLIREYSRLGWLDRHRRLGTVDVEDTKEWY